MIPLATMAPAEGASSGPTENLEPSIPAGETPPSEPAAQLADIDAPKQPSNPESLKGEPEALLPSTPAEFTGFVAPRSRQPACDAMSGWIRAASQELDHTRATLKVRGSQL